jgi:hypothetical protein
MTHKKEVWAVLIVVVGIAAILVYFAAQAVGRVMALQQMNAITTNVVDTSSWETYHNAQFGFSVQYPDNWQIFSGGLAAADPFIAFGDPLSGTSTYTMYLFVEQNPQSLSSANYAHQVLSDDRAQDEANAKIGPAPTVTPQFKSNYLTTVNGNAAYELFDVFEFDHNAERVYVANNTIALRFDFPVADANPNLSAPANNNAVAHMIMQTLTFD